MPNIPKNPVILHDNRADSGVARVEIECHSADSEHGAEWRKLVNMSTGHNVLVQLHSPESPDATITRVLISRDDGVTSVSLREFPVAAIQSAYRARHQAQEMSTRTYQAAGMDDSYEAIAQDPFRPILRAKRDDKFYALVAMQYRVIAKQSENPTRGVAEANETSLATAQRWLWEARKRKFLPPGKQGRRTKKQDTNGGE